MGAMGPTGMMPALTRPLTGPILACVPEMKNPTAELFWKVVGTPGFPELGQGPRPGVTALKRLQGQLDEVLAGSGTGEEDRALLRAVAFLYHDHHDAAHDIVQDLSDADGSLLHGILHRREPDYWNAKYWFRRFVAHPAHIALGRRIPSLVTGTTGAAVAKEITRPGAFDPFAFVDAVEAAARRPADDPESLWLRAVQHAEFEEIVAHLLS